MKGEVRGITNADDCPCCRHALEIIMHCLRDCEIIKDLWKIFITMKGNYKSTLFNLGFSHWIDMNLQTIYIGFGQ